MYDPYAAIARFYDRTARQDGDLPLYEALALRYGDPVLEIGAGTGRLAVPLARAGHSIVALEPSGEMMAIGQAKAGAEGATVNWVHGRIEQCDVEPGFGLIFCAIDGFLHLVSDDDQGAALAAVRRLLRPGGCLALDLPTLAAWSDWQPGVRPLELYWSQEDAHGVRTSHYGTFRADPARQVRHVLHIFEEVQPDGSVRRWTAEFELRFIGRYEIALMLARAGLNVIGMHGNYELGPLQEDSERMIVLAERVAETG